MIIQPLRKFRDRLGKVLVASFNVSILSFFDWYHVHQRQTEQCRL